MGSMTGWTPLPQSNPFEERERMHKARDIADVLAAMSVTADIARDMSAAGRILAARAAKRRPPSDATWDEVVELLVLAEKVRAGGADAVFDRINRGSPYGGR